MNMERLTIPYPDFKLHDIIEPDEFDFNNDAIVEKINDVLTLLNTITNSIEDGGSGADYISVAPISPFISTKLQTFLNEVIGRLRSTTSGTSGAGFIGTPTIAGVTGSTVSAQLASLKTLLDTEKNRITALTTRVTNVEGKVVENETKINTHNHDTRYMTRSELIPYLTGGETIVRIEVFTIVNSNNGNGTFTYRLNNGTQRTGTLGANGEQIFSLERGTYQLNLNHIKAIINDTLQRSVASGGLVEIAKDKVALSSPEGAGTEVTVEYFERIGVSGDYSVSYGAVEPAITGGSVIWFKVVG